MQQTFSMMINHDNYATTGLTRGHTATDTVTQPATAAEISMINDNMICRIFHVTRTILRKRKLLGYHFAA